MKLGRNPIELVVLEPLGGVPEPNLDHNGPKNQKLKQKNKIEKGMKQWSKKSAPGASATAI